jgi:Leucine-rich repeat (LRR) protein
VPWLAEQPELEELDISKNRVHSIGSELAELKSLKSLRLSENFIGESKCHCEFEKLLKHSPHS